MDSWHLVITKVNNGYILRGKFGNSEEITERVIEIADTNGDELCAMQNVLYEVMEYFAVYKSKHNKKNLCVEIK